MIKIIKDNSQPAKPEYPQSYNCQVCTSELEIETAADIGEVDVPLINTGKKDEKGKTIPDGTIKGKGFYCPVCGSLNITG